MNNLLKNRTKIVFRKLGANKQIPFLVNGNSYLTLYPNSIKYKILKELENMDIGETIQIKDLIERTKKEKEISVRNEITFLSRANILTLERGTITLKRKVQEVKK